MNNKLSVDAEELVPVSATSRSDRANNPAVPATGIHLSYSKMALSCFTSLKSPDTEPIKNMLLINKNR
jgi:hypothetical protein